MPVVQGWWAARFHQVSLILLLYPPKGWYWFCMRLETSLPGSHSWINQDGGRSSFKGKSPISVPFPLARAQLHGTFQLQCLAGRSCAHQNSEGSVCHEKEVDCSGQLACIYQVSFKMYITSSIFFRQKNCSHLENLNSIQGEKKTKFINLPLRIVIIWELSFWSFFSHFQ